jgi:dethiobiotin synthetase
MSNFFISGIGTDVGKTVVSSILVEALQADYWKPVQAGDLAFGDCDRAKSLITNKKSQFHPETYRLNTPASPHFAAEVDGIEIGLDAFQLPKTENTLIVEGAGGLLVPLNSKETVLDLIQKLKIPVILVSRNYLGSINHTMLSVEVLKQRNIPIAGIVFNGVPNPATESWILNASALTCLARIGNADGEVDRSFVLAQAELNKESIIKILIK